MSQPCHDFHRSQHHATVGIDVPAIEPGMPTPAGAGMDRKEFVLKSVGTAVAVYGVSKWSGIDVLEEGIAEAAAAPDQPVLVQIFLPGGLDSLSMLAPINDGRYQRLRPTLKATGGKVFSEDNRLRWHPSADALATLHAEGKVSVMPAVGYDHPDQSHFTSRHYWEVGKTDARETSGWLGRYLDHAGSPTNPLQGLSMNGQMAPSLASKKNPVSALNSIGEYIFGMPGVWGDVHALMQNAITDIGKSNTGSSDPQIRSIGSVAQQAGVVRDQLAQFIDTSGMAKPTYTSPVTYPKYQNIYLPQKLADIAAMLAAGLPLRCVAVDAAGNYDTHDRQAAPFATNVKQTCESILAFQRDLEARGLADRVIIQVWTEFGRRVEENASMGTDHGAAGIGFLIGTRVRGKMIGEFPGLKRLDLHGNLRATADFRAVYSSLLEQWFQTDAGIVIPGAKKFARPKLIK